MFTASPVTALHMLLFAGQVMQVGNYTVIDGWAAVHCGAEDFALIEKIRSFFDCIISKLFRQIPISTEEKGLLDTIIYNLL